MAVGIYPHRNHEAFIEIGKTSGPLILLSSGVWSLLNQCVTSGENKLTDPLINVKIRQHFKKDYLCIRVDNVGVSLNMDELYMLVNLYTCLTRQLSKFELSYDVIKQYCLDANVANEFVEPADSAVDYELLYDEIQSQRQSIFNDVHM